ncbi:hypothetical protein BASA81_002887 [Batrachochytrium salamandrivorans]|nr:hypothetical protein BASA81_002887 [Batrachochytrium salamandrivorans]
MATLTYRFPLSIIDKNHHHTTTFSDIRPCSRLNHYLRSILAPILGHQMEHVSKIDRRTTKHGARFRITVPEDRQRNYHPAPRAPKQSKPTGVFGKTTDIAVQTSLDQQPHLHHYHGRSSQSMLPISATNDLLFRHIVRNTRLWAISETCITSSKFRFTVPGFDVIQHPATGPGRRGIALGIPSCFGGHEHGSAVGTMILAKTLQKTTLTQTQDIHQLTSQFLESANAVADQLESSTLTTSTRSNRRLLSGATTRCHIGKQHCTASIHCRCNSYNPDPVQCNTLRDEWSRLKAAATQLERGDGRKQWVKHA